MKTTTTRWSLKTTAVLLAAAFLSLAGSIEAAKPQAQPKAHSKNKAVPAAVAPSQQSQSAQAQSKSTAGLMAPATLFTAQIPVEQSASRDEASSEVTAAPALPPSIDAIAAGTYPFTSASVAVEDMSTGTTQLVGAAQDDTASVATNIGFDVWFDGVRQTQFSVNANGLFGFGAVVVNNGASGRTNDFATATNNPKVSALWDDLCTGAAGKVHYKVVGAAPNRKLVVEWLNMVWFDNATVACGTTILGKFQVWVFESTGVVELVSGGTVIDGGTNGGYSVGIGSSATSFASVTVAGATASYAVSNNAQSDPIASGTAYIFTPNVPAAPTGLNFTGVGSGGMTVNWTDNATNEVGYAIYNSTDGGANYTFVTQAAANANSFVASGLSPSTSYTWKIQAVTEGALSTPLTGTQATTAAANISSTVVGGNWSVAGTWVGGVVPSSADNVTIVSGSTVTVDTAAACNNLTVSGTLQYEDTATARSLAAGGTVTVNSTGILRASSIASVTGTHTFSVGLDLINNGTMDFNLVGAGTSNVGMTFTGANNAAWTTGAASTTDVATVTMNKGTSNANTLTFTPAGTFTVLGAGTSGFLTITNGTFKISGSAALSNPIFAVAAYTIPATGGFWLNNANCTVVGQAGNSTMNGLLRLTAGTFNEGLVSGNAMTSAATTVNVIVEGATLNIASRFAFTGGAPSAFTMSSGTVNVTTVGSTAATGFGFAAGSIFTMSGGTINLVQASTTAPDYNVGSTALISGGTLNVGTAATTAASTFRIQGQMPNVVIDNTTNTKNANLNGQMNVWGNLTINTGCTLNLNPGTAQVLLQIGPTITNNGAIVVNTNNTSQVVFGGNLQLTSVGGVGSPQTYTGTGTFGTAAVSVGTLGLQNGGNLTLTGGVSALNVLRVNLLFGNIIGSGAINLGNGGTSQEIVQRGVTSNVLPAGAFDVAPVFNIGSGGLIEVYAPSTGVINTGFEIPPTRTVFSMQIQNPIGGVTLTGGPLTSTSGTNALLLAGGTFNTTAANMLTVANTAAASVTGGNASTYVNGPLARTLPASLVSGSTYTFPVGKGSFKMLELVNPTTNAGGTVVIQAEVFDANSGGTAGAGFSSINTNRYWSASATTGAGNFTNTTVRLTEVGIVGANAIGQSATQAGTYDSIGGTVAAPVIGPSSSITSLGFFAIGTLTGAPTISGTQNVGTGQTFTNLTSAVAAYNTRVQTGPVTFLLTDSAYTTRGGDPSPDATGETFPITINANPGASSTNTVTIKPAPATTVAINPIAASPTAIFILNGADWVTIDGSNTVGGTSRDLTLANISTSTSSAVIWGQTIGTTDPATNNTIKNVNITGNASTTTIVGIGFGSSTISATSVGTRNDNNRVENNNITAVQFGVYSQGASAVIKNVGTVITGNQIGGAGASGLGRAGILVGFEDGTQITNNKVTNVSSAASSDAFGIGVGTSTIASTAITSNETVNVTVTGNTVSGVVETGTFSAAGIAYGTPGYGTSRFANNMVSGVNCNGTPSDFPVGIFIGGTANALTQVYFNSVSMTGSKDISTTATAPSYALAILGTNPLVDIRDNILYNTQTSVGVGSNSYAIGLGAFPPYTNVTSNFNDLFTSGPQSTFARTGSLAILLGADSANLAAWQGATGKDANSISSDPLFVNTPDNLHVPPTSPVFNAGTPAGGIVTDIDGDTRPAGSPG